MQRQQQKEQTTYEHFNQKEQKALEAFFDSKVDLITAGLQPRFNKYLKDERMITRDNAHVICDYIIAMNTEINPSSNYRQTLCAKCRMVLSYDAYQETLKEQEKQRLNTDKMEQLLERINILEDKILSSNQ